MHLALAATHVRLKPGASRTVSLSISERLRQVVIHRMLRLAVTVSLRGPGAATAVFRRAISLGS